RDGLSLLDQAIAYTGSQLTDEGVATMLGTVDRGRVGALLDALSAGDGAALVAEIERLGEFSPDWDDVLEALAEALHHVQLRQLVPGAAIEADGVDIDALAGALAPEVVQLWYQMALNGRRDLPLAPSPRAGFEMVALRMLAFRPGAAMSTGNGGGAARNERPAAPPSRGNAATAARAALDDVPKSAAAPVPPRVERSAPATVDAPAPSRAERPAPVTADAPVPRRADVAERPAADMPHVDAPPSIAEPATAAYAESAAPAASRGSSDGGLSDADAWRDWVAGCDLRGPARLLAEHVGFIGCGDGLLRLSIEPDDEHLKGPTMLKMLADALAPRFGQAPQIRFETPARPVDSVRVHIERARDARQADAERAFEQHPDVRRLVAAGGRVVPESVRPLDR
ncbi:MAG TPA: DNA polymerase III subunit gamma/tau, partial [Lysobacter sp.]